MTVSRRVNYPWRCDACGSPQAAPVWRIVYSRERNDVVDRAGPELAEVTCGECGRAAEIDEPLLVIRPGDQLPLLLGLPVQQLEHPEHSSRELAKEAVHALGGRIGIPGPMIPLPRILIPAALTRDVISDARHPGSVAEDAFGDQPVLAGMYQAFLQSISDGEPERKVASALQDLWSVQPQELAGFLAAHGELASMVAVSKVRRELAEHTDADSELFRARLALVEGLASGVQPADIACEYLAALEHFGGLLNSEFSGLVANVRANPGPDGIPYLQRAGQMAAELGNEPAEAYLGADLAARLLAGPAPSSEVLDEAIALLERSLRLIGEDDRQWLDIASNLAAAYRLRSTGDARQNWEAAQQLMERVSNVADRAADPRKWAVIQTNYGLLLAERPDAGPADLSRGIAHMQAGLQERSPERGVVDWAYSQLNLGLIYSRRGADGDFASALDCYREALARLEPDDDVQLWGTLQSNLADLHLQADSPDLAAAAATARSALVAIESTADPITAGRLRWTSARLEERLSGPDSAEALRLRQEAFRMLPPRLAPDLHLRIGGELLEAYGRLGDFAAQAEVAEIQLATFNYLYDTQVTGAGQRKLLERWPRLARWAAYALARAGRATEAVEAIEQGRARQLSVALSRDTADLARLAATDESLAGRYRETLSTYRDVGNAATAPVPPADLELQIAAAEQQIQQVLSEVRDIPGFERFLLPSTISDISADAGGNRIIYLLCAPWGSYVLTVHPGPEGPSADAIPVPEVTSADISQLTLVGAEGTPGLLLAQEAAPGLDLLPIVLERLGELTPLIQKVADVIADAPERVAVLIPTGLLGLIPLVAVPVNGESGDVLDDIGEVHFAPSAAVYAACRRRAAAHGQQRLTGVADPDGTPPLPWSRIELKAIQDMFHPESPASCAFGPDATRTWLLEHLHGASHVHLACHGSSEFTSKAGGYLLLAGDSKLSVEDLIEGRLTGCRVAIASACQSGHFSTTDTPDEFTGLPAGFLQAGAACAVTSLWPVYDHSTALLMMRFYELLGLSPDKASSHPISALRQARMWLRHLTEEQVTRFVQSRPRLAESMGDLSTNRAASGEDHARLPYISPQHWAPFVAWGY
jgi:tetratricopeptide (TPR) repeat protein